MRLPHTTQYQTRSLYWFVGEWNGPTEPREKKKTMNGDRIASTSIRLWSLLEKYVENAPKMPKLDEGMKWVEKIKQCGSHSVYLFRYYYRIAGMLQCQESTHQRIEFISELSSAASVKFYVSRSPVPVEINIYLYRCTLNEINSLQHGLNDE